MNEAEKNLKQLQAKWQAEAEAKEAMLKRAMTLLADHGFKLSVGGCSCCDSPWVHLQYNGENIIYHTRDGDAHVYSMDDCNFDMFEDKSISHAAPVDGPGFIDDRTKP